MLLAYLRGLLKPTSENGYCSLLREEFIFAAIESELSASYMQMSVNLDTQLLPLLKSDQLKQTYSEIKSRQKSIKFLRELNYTDFEKQEVETKEVTGEQKQFAQIATKLYNYMDNKGMLETK